MYDIGEIMATFMLYIWLISDIALILFSSFSLYQLERRVTKPFYF